MSFMINPIPYDDLTAINYLDECVDIKSNIQQNPKKINRVLMKKINSLSNGLILIDGYFGADFNEFLKLLDKDAGLTMVDVREFYKSEEQLQPIFDKFTPENIEEDPAQIFGKLFSGGLLDLLNLPKIEAFLTQVDLNNDKTIVFGVGSANEFFKDLSNLIIYLDVTPKEAALRIHDITKSIGSPLPISFKERIRRYYFIETKVLHEHRKNLQLKNLIDLYVLSNKPGKFECFEYSDVVQIFNQLHKRPFRAKPIYLEGVWGGEYVKKIRNLNDEIKCKVAWVFEFIPLEASVAVDIDGLYLDFPFYTFMNVCPNEIIGQRANKEFNGSFPIRFNWDDTWHSNGNMSIQVHPNEKFAKENYNELGGQDEAYYIVATGHDARTYCGFKGDPQEFLSLCEKSATEGTEVDYLKYVNYVDSKPGLQVMIPTGTIHASGRNQLVLELGSLTIGAYTYKMYDYIRKDIDGTLRPIHLHNARKVLETTRDANWVNEHSIITPKLISKTKDYEEFLVGFNKDIYFETFKINMKARSTYSQKNEDEFTVITVVDGESVKITCDKSQNYYIANYLDVVTVPASVESFTVEALGYQPVVLHKTRLKKEFKKNEKN